MTRAVTITTLNTPKNKPNQLTSECFCSFGNDWEGPDLNLHPTSNEKPNYFHPSGSTISLLCSNSSTCTCTLVRTLALVAEGFQKFCELMSLSKNTSICKMPHPNSKCAMPLLQNVDTVLFRENNMNTQQKKHVQNVGKTKLLRPGGFLDWNTVSRIFWLWHFSDRHATEHLPEFRSSKEVQEARCSGQCIAHRGVAWRRRLGPVRLLAWSSRCVLARRIACPALGTAAREMRDARTVCFQRSGLSFRSASIWTSVFWDLQHWLKERMAYESFKQNPWASFFAVICCRSAAEIGSPQIKQVSLDSPVETSASLTSLMAHRVEPAIATRCNSTPRN